MNIEKVKFVERYDTPKRIWFRNKETGYPSVCDFIGKTKRSFVSGGGWDCKLWPFTLYEEITEHNYQEWLWLWRNRHYIGERVQRLRDPAKLREIAKIVGYEEKQEGGGR